MRLNGHHPVRVGGRGYESVVLSVPNLVSYWPDAKSDIVGGWDFAEATAAPTHRSLLARDGRQFRDYDGSNHRGVSGYTFSVDRDWSLMAWLRIDSHGGNSPCVFGTTGNFSGEAVRLLYLHNNSALGTPGNGWTYFHNTGSTNNSAGWSSLSIDNTAGWWQGRVFFLLLTHDWATHTLTLYGAREASGLYSSPRSITLAAPSTNGYLCSGTFQLALSTDGYMDGPRGHLAHWNRCLTAAEATTLYLAGINGA